MQILIRRNDTAHIVFSCYRLLLFPLQCVVAQMPRSYSGRSYADNTIDFHITNKKDKHEKCMGEKLSSLEACAEI